MDKPGHYMRRIKTMALSIPCVAGPYTSVNCTLTQSFSKVRKDTDAASYDDADHFHESFGRPQTIVTSTGRQDSGLFETNLRDERYLPFEGTGAISRWRLQLPRENNRFDVRTVSDVIFHLHYTARDGGEALREAARTATKAKLATGMRVFDLRTEFASEWSRFKHPQTGQDAKLTMHLGAEHFPLRRQGEGIAIDAIELNCAIRDATAPPLAVTVKLGTVSSTYALPAGSGPGALRSQQKPFRQPLGDVAITAKADAVARIEELMVLCRYVPSPAGATT
jgi:hypothetical protein